MDRHGSEDVPLLKPTDRVLALRERVRRTKPAICSDRAKLVTESYSSTEGLPETIRQAKAIGHILTNMSIYINAGELIVGNQARLPRSGPIFFPQVSAEDVERDLDLLPSRPQDPFEVSEEVKTELKEAIAYWRGRTLPDKFRARTRMIPEVYEANRAGVVQIKASDDVGHHTLDCAGILRAGLKGIIEDLRQRILHANLAQPGEYEKREFWRALLIVAQAVVAFAGRFSQLAREMAAAEKDSGRVQELERIAEICSWVPNNPPRTFYEALQAIWFIALLAHLTQNGTGITIGRLDQLLWPYLKRDLAAGRSNYEEAQELLDCFWIKTEEINKWRSTTSVGEYAGYLTDIAIILGGQNSAGEDATNPVTYMCLQAEEHVHLRSPQLGLRIHAGTPNKLLLRALEVVRLGGGKPQFLNDVSYIQVLQSQGVPLKAARDYAPIGCSEPGLVGARIFLRSPRVSLPKVVELTLNNGIDPATGNQLGPATGHVGEFTRFDDFMEAFKKQLRYFIGLAVEANNSVAEPLLKSELPQLFLSLVTPGCIEKGRDITAGGALYNWGRSTLWGFATAVNSLAALKKVVFEDEAVAFPQVVESLRANFAGDEGERIRQLLLKAPKYGNDDDYADSLGKEILDVASDEYSRYTTPRGGCFVPSVMTLTANVANGKKVGATPDGRFAGTPFSDGISPAQGTEVLGPTASFKSVAKMDHARLGGGVILNQKINPDLLKDPANLRKLAALIRTYFLDLGGQHVQLNVVSGEILRKAQENPEEYRDLLVRVVGYSAYFVELSKEVQNDIIARTEHMVL